MKKLFWLALTLFVLANTACSIWPKSWRFGGTPVEREAKSAAALQSTRNAEIGAAQRAVHQTGIALEAATAQAPDSKPLAAARDFNAEAQALIDEAHGAPGAGDEAAWKKVVADLIAGQTKEREAQAAEVAALSAKLRKVETQHEHTLEELRRDSEDNTFWSDVAHKLMFAVIAFVLFVVATHLVGIAAQLNPGSALLGGAATALHSVVASGAVVAARSATDSLKRVGAGLALVRQELPGAAQRLTQFFDAATAAHPHVQQTIAAGATAAGSPPPS